MAWRPAPWRALVDAKRTDITVAAAPGFVGRPAIQVWQRMSRRRSVHAARSKGNMSTAASAVGPGIAT